VQEKLFAQIATLPSLNKAQLLAIWAKNCGNGPRPYLRKERMIPILAVGEADDVVDFAEGYAFASEGVASHGADVVLIEAVWPCPRGGEEDDPPFTSIAMYQKMRAQWFAPRIDKPALIL